MVFLFFPPPPFSLSRRCFVSIKLTLQLPSQLKSSSSPSSLLWWRTATIFQCKFREANKRWLKEQTDKKRVGAVAKHLPQVGTIKTDIIMIFGGKDNSRTRQVSFVFCKSTRAFDYWQIECNYTKGPNIAFELRRWINNDELFNSRIVTRLSMLVISLHPRTENVNYSPRCFVTKCLSPKITLRHNSNVTIASKGVSIGREGLTLQIAARW